jgi:predicted phosphoribosyltransferase
MQDVFRNRTEAGRLLAERLTAYAGRTDVLVLALPRGGVPVAYEVARALEAPLDVFVVRKLGVPGHQELAMGAIAAGGVCVLNDDVVEALRIPRGTIESVAARELRELRRRERAYRGDRPPLKVRGRTVIVVDDGLATGSTCAEFRNAVDELVCEITPEPFYAVGQSYEDFSPTTDEEVRELLGRAENPGAAATMSQEEVAP